jgi:hypothetical protein
MFITVYLLSSQMKLITEGVISSASYSDLTFLLVVRMFCRLWLLCPIAVAGVIFKYLLMASSVRPGYVAK